jgi:hypothetical protein
MQLSSAIESNKQDFYFFYNIKYHYFARCLSLTIFIGIILLYYLWDSHHPAVVPILVTGCIICVFTGFSTCKKYLVKLHARPLWLEDIEGYEDRDLASNAVKMFGWLMVISASISAGIAAFSLPNILLAVKTKSFIEVLALIGGLISLYRITISFIGSIALSIIINYHDSLGAKRTPELRPHLKRDLSVELDTCDLNSDIRDISNTTRSVITFPCTDTEQETSTSNFYCWNNSSSNKKENNITINNNEH